MFALVERQKKKQTYFLKTYYLMHLSNSIVHINACKTYYSSWVTSTSSQVSDCDGAVLETYLDHKFQLPQEGLNCESLAYEVVT